MLCERTGQAKPIREGAPEEWGRDDEMRQRADIFQGYQARLAGRIRGACLIGLIAAGCDSPPDTAHSGSSELVETSDSIPAAVDITAVDYAFAAPDTLPPGWTTFRMRNIGEEHHLLLLYRLPEGRTYAEYMELAPPFERVMHAVESAEVTEEEAVARLRAVLPEWAADVDPWEGPVWSRPG